jgi:hypothetical protein
MRKRILEAAKNLLFQHLSNNIRKKIIFIILDMLTFLLLVEKHFRKDSNKVVAVKEDISRRNKNNSKRKRNLLSTKQESCQGFDNKKRL